VLVHWTDHETKGVRRREIAMAEIVDASGLSCPQPVLMTLNKIKDLNKGEIEVLVDTDTSKENVSRAAESQGWEVADVTESGTGYKILIKKA
jgi:tRNA 2-thiouridine synthesizing protein A